MKKQQYKKYLKSKRKVLGKPKDMGEVIAAIQLATAAVISAIQISKAMQNPIPKAKGFQSGGFAITGERGSEMICTDNPFKDSKFIFIRKNNQK